MVGYHAKTEFICELERANEAAAIATNELAAVAMLPPVPHRLTWKIPIGKYKGAGMFAMPIYSHPYHPLRLSSAFASFAIAACILAVASAAYLRASTSVTGD